MKCKILGMFFLLSVVAMLCSCNSDSTAAEDECLDDPNAPGCTMPEDVTTSTEAE